MSITVVSLVGVIGTGKTTAIRRLESAGYAALSEDYVAINQALPCDNRFVLSKWAWIADWFHRIRLFAKQNPEVTLVFTDRSAIEAGLWTERCASLFEPLSQSFSEMEELGYRFVNICLRCDKAQLWKRIRQRLAVEPIRLNYNEGNELFFNSLYDFYSLHETRWDMVLDTTSCSEVQIFHEIIHYVHTFCELSPSP